MGEIHRFDKSRRKRFRSDVIMPRIHDMMLRSFDAKLRRRHQGLWLTMIALLAALTFVVIFTW
jgi:hypothetical protein